MNYFFKIVEDIPWELLHKTYDSNIFKTKIWANFLQKSCNVTPLVIEISTSKRKIGWFYGQKIKKFGISIIASPFEGWTTSYQGLCLQQIVTKTERVEIYKELKDFCFRNKLCLFFQVSDWELDFEEVNQAKLYSEPIKSYWLDLTPTIDELFKSFKAKSCQYSIHKAQKLGVIVREPESIKEYAKEYYNQLSDVFAKQNLKPTYDETRVYDMLQEFEGTRNIVLLEALHPETKASMACIIFVFHNKMAFYWGASSYRNYQKYCPNELLMFEAIKRVKELGCNILEMEGIRPYKEKYNPIKYSKPKIIIAKYSILIPLKNLAKKMYPFLKNMIILKKEKI